MKQNTQAFLPRFDGHWSKFSLENGTGIPILLDHISQFRFLSQLFAVIFMVTLSIDWISGIQGNWITLCIGSLTKGLAYTLATFLSYVLYFRLRRINSIQFTIHQREIWIISSLGYLYGFFLLTPYRIYFGHLSSHGTENSILFLLKAFLFWALLTQIFVISRKRHTGETTTDSTVEPLQLNSTNRETFKIPNGHNSGMEIDLSSIRWVSVDEHYCELSFENNGSIQKIEFKASLTATRNDLGCDTFFQCHRSMLIHLDSVEKLIRNGRSFFVSMCGSDKMIRVSRNRRQALVRELQQRGIVPFK